MKRTETRLWMMFAFLSALGVMGCSSDKGEVNPSLAWHRSSGCKSEPKLVKAKGESAFPWDEELVEYEKKENSQLYLKHVNAIFNCGTDEVQVSATIDGRNINIIEQGDDVSANCVCPFDVECLVNGLTDGIYKIGIYQGSLSNLRYEFVIEYTSSMTKGTYHLSSE